MNQPHTVALKLTRPEGTGAFQPRPGRQRRGAAWEPAPPLILAAWWDTPSFAKMERLAEHIGYANTHGARFLRALPEAEWAHLNEFLTKPVG